METVQFLLSNWYWIAPGILGLLAILKIAAKRTKWVIDDQIITFLIGIIRLTQGKEPLSDQRKDKIAKRYPSHNDRGVEV